MNEIFPIIIVTIFVIIFYISPVIITVFNVLNLLKRNPIKEKNIDIFTFLLGIPFSLILFASWNAKDYSTAILLDPNTFRLHTPISFEHSLTFIVLLPYLY